MIYGLTADKALILAINDLTKCKAMNSVFTFITALGATVLTSLSLASVAMAQSRPIEFDDPMVLQCQERVNAQVRQDFALERLLWSTDTTTATFISNAETGIAGKGQFLQTDGWHDFSYNCTINIRNGAVTAASYTLETGNQGETSRPADPSNPLVRQCQANIANKVRRDYTFQNIIWDSGTTTEYFISNAETGIRGQGQFLQTDGWHSFSYDCKFNIRNGTLASSSYSLAR